MVKAQLLAFLVYTTPASLQLQLQGMGPVEQLAEDSEAELSRANLEEMLSEPHPVLHRLVSFDAGMGSPGSPCQAGARHALLDWYHKDVLARLFCICAEQMVEFELAGVEAHVWWM